MTVTACHSGSKVASAPQAQHSWERHCTPCRSHGCAHLVRPPPSTKGPRTQPEQTNTVLNKFLMETRCSDSRGLAQPLEVVSQQHCGADNTHSSLLQYVHTDAWRLSNREAGTFKAL